MVLDPRSMLAYFLLGIKSYLSLAALANLIDPRQPMFNLFIEGEPQALFTFLLSQYELIVNGLVKERYAVKCRSNGFSRRYIGLIGRLSITISPVPAGCGCPFDPTARRICLERRVRCRRSIS